MLNRRAFLKTVGLGAAAAALPRVAPGAAAATAAKKPPNIVFIMADDLGYGDLGCYGQQKIRTPVLDAMAAKGLRLTRFHAGYTVCLPSRCALMTGLHTGHGRCRTNGGGGSHPELAREDTTVATVLKAAGYKTAMTGKWSLGDRFVGCAVAAKCKEGTGEIYSHGWDFYFGEPNQTYNHSYYPDVLYRYDRYGMVGRKTEGSRLDQVPLKDNKKKRNRYGHDLLTENALAFIDAAKDGPFFLYVPYAIPHAKFEIPELAPYAAAASWSKNDKAYASMITRMDRDIGRILMRLEKHGLEKNTLVIFTSDNGAAGNKAFNCNGGLPGGKGSLQDGGLRVPGIACWPGTIRPGRTSDHLSAFWDIMPTFAELAGIEPPAPIDGISMVPTLLGKGKQPEHKYLYFNKAGRNAPAGRIIRGKTETRTDAEILKEARTEVVVPKFTATRTRSA